MRVRADAVTSRTPVGVAPSGTAFTGPTMVIRANASASGGRDIRHLRRELRRDGKLVEPCIESVLPKRGGDPLVVHWGVCVDPIALGVHRQGQDLAEEAEVEKRYAEASREAKERELARLQAELGVVCYAAPGKRGKLRIVA